MSSIQLISIRLHVISALSHHRSSPIVLWWLFIDLICFRLIPNFIAQIKIDWKMFFISLAKNYKFLAPRKWKQKCILCFAAAKWNEKKELKSLAEKNHHKNHFSSRRDLGGYFNVKNSRLEFLHTFGSDADAFYLRRAQQMFRIFISLPKANQKSHFFLMLRSERIAEFFAESSFFRKPSEANKNCKAKDSFVKS